MQHASDQQALTQIGRGADEILNLEELEARLKLGRPLTLRAALDFGTCIPPGYSRASSASR